MSARSLPIVQNAWFVPDIGAAIKPWLAMGVGPFYVFDINVPDALYRGNPVPLAYKVAMAQAGDVQVELLSQTSPGPSAFTDSFPDGGSGLHHVCRSPGDYDEVLAQLQADGIAIATAADIGGSRWCYADTRAQLGCMLELTDDSDATRGLMQMVREAAANWDGSEPIRRLSIG